MKTSYRELEERVAEIVEEGMPENAEDGLATFSDVHLDNRVALEAKGENIQFPCWGQFNRMVNGIRTHEFTILCGPTGAGKTTLLANWACLLGYAGIPLFVGAVETGRHDFLRVVAGILAGRDPYKPWEPGELMAVQEKHPQVLNSKQHVFTCYDSRVRHRRFLADLLYAHETFGTKVALVDNLNFLLEVKSGQDQLVAMDQAVHDFVVFVKKIPMHVVMVMHPRKTEKGRVESEFDIKGSSTAVQEAANVILWNRLANESDAAYDAHPNLCRELKFAKVRKNGRAVGARIIYSVDKVSPKLHEGQIL